MKIAKLLIFLAIGSFSFIGCLPKAVDSSISTISTSAPTFTYTPKTEKTEIIGEPVPWDHIIFYDSAKTNYEATKEEDKPRLSVITRQDEIISVEKWIRPEHLPLIRGVDYNDALVLVIFSGVRGQTDHGIEINQIVKNGNEVTLSVTFTTPAEGEAHGQIITSPYLILEIQRMNLPENPKFILIADGKEIDRIDPG